MVLRRYCLYTHSHTRAIFLSLVPLCTCSYLLRLDPACNYKRRWRNAARNSSMGLSDQHGVSWTRLTLSSRAKELLLLIPAAVTLSTKLMFFLWWRIYQHASRGLGSGPSLRRSLLGPSALRTRLLKSNNTAASSSSNFRAYHQHQRLSRRVTFQRPGFHTYRFTLSTNNTYAQWLAARVRNLRIIWR